MSDPHKLAKDELQRALQAARDELLGALQTAGTAAESFEGQERILGLVHDQATVEAAYLGVVFDNPFPEHLPGLTEHAEPEPGRLAGESPESAAALYRRVWAHTDETVDVLGLGSPGRVPWRPADGADVNLHTVLVHVVAQAHRRAGQAALIRASNPSPVTRT